MSSTEYLVAAKPAPPLNIPPSSATVTVRVIDRYVSHMVGADRKYKTTQVLNSERYTNKMLNMISEHQSN